MDQYLTIIQYESSADQTYLVMNNEQIFGYFEDPETSVNAMISIMTKEQYETLLSKGYYIQIVEKNPKITNYALYKNKDPNKGELLVPIGKVYVLTDNHTLVRKVEQTVVYDIEPSTFTEIPLVDMKAEIAYNNKVDLSETVTPTESQILTGIPQFNSKIPLSQKEIIPVITTVVVAVLLLIVSGYLLWRKFRKTPPQTINDSPLPPIS